MKIILIIIFSVIAFHLNAQSKVTGNYFNNFGEELKVNLDSTFMYKWRFDLSSSWTKGKWRIKNDTIFFNKIPILDTLKYTNSKGLVTDSLVLSLDEKVEIITKEDLILYHLISGGQNRQLMPNKLFYRNGRLYNIDEKGSLIKKRVKGFGTKKKVVPWYISRQ